MAGRGVGSRDILKNSINQSLPYSVRAGLLYGCIIRANDPAADTSLAIQIFANNFIVNF